MKAQSIALYVAAGVTAAFLAAVAAVIVPWQMFAPQQHAVVAQPPVFPNQPQVAFNNNFRFDVELPPMAHQPPAFETPLTPENLPLFRSVKVPECTVSAPVTHGNLAIYLIHGPDALKDQEILTLQEALEQRVAVVHETRTMQLSVDNLSNKPLFIQSGDIIKGGTQDRTLPYDMLVPQLTSRMPLQALCVEQGRSSPRGQEVSTSFQSSTQQLPTRTLKLAAYRQAQNDVWANVINLQARLSRNVGAPVQNPLSQTSLQLTLENPRTQDAIQQYMAKLAPATEGEDDVIGFAVAVNGKIHSADVYASAGLFQKLWPKLVRASAVEALSELQKGTAFKAPTGDAVKTFLSSAEQSQAFQRKVTNRTVVVRQENQRTLLYDACDPTHENVVLHRSLIAK